MSQNCDGIGRGIVDVTATLTQGALYSDSAKEQ